MTDSDSSTSRPRVDRRSGYVNRISNLRVPRKINTAVNARRGSLPLASMSELSKIFDEDGEGKQQRIQDFTSSQQAEVGVSDLITEPDLIAPHSSPEDDDEDAERNRDDLFRQYAANVEKWNAEAAEKLRTYRETPIYYSPSQHITTPQMSISISGPQNISITIPYPLDLTLTHHNNPRSQPITIRETGTPLDLQTHAFRLYTDDDGSPGLPVSHAAQTPIAAAESPINGPRSRRLQVGESETRSIELRTDLWELIAGMKLWIRLPHGMITGWQYGTSAGMSTRRLSYSGSMDDNTIMIPASNAIAVEVID